MNIMTKKIIRLGLSLITLIPISSLLYAQQNSESESCQQAQKNLREKEFKACFSGELENKRNQLIDQFENIRVARENNGAIRSRALPSSTPRPETFKASPAPTVIRSTPEQPQTQPSKRVNPYNY